MLFCGRSVGIRTRGLLDPNQARYQTSPHPVSLCIIMKIEDIVKSFAIFSLPMGMKTKTIPYAFWGDVRNEFELLERFAGKRKKMLGREVGDRARRVFADSIFASRAAVAMGGSGCVGSGCPRSVPCPCTETDRRPCRTNYHWRQRRCDPNGTYGCHTGMHLCFGGPFGLRAAFFVISTTSQNGSLCAGALFV